MKNMESANEKERANAWLEEKVEFTGKIAGHKYWILKSRPWMNEASKTTNKPDIKGILKRMEDSSGYNGYMLFEKRPVREQGYSGIMAYVPVHGGITYAREDEKGIVYGFDTCHIDQDRKLIRDPKWIKKELRAMYEGIMRAKKVESKYLKALSPKGKAKHAAYVYTLERPAGKLGFSAMINLITGEI